MISPVDIELEEMTSKQFKKKFKVGDVVAGWTGRKLFVITSIGEYRFLYRDYPFDPEHFGFTEHVASTRYGKWKLLKRLGRDYCKKVERRARLDVY